MIVTTRRMGRIWQPLLVPCCTRGTRLWMQKEALQRMQRTCTRPFTSSQNTSRRQQDVSTPRPTSTFWLFEDPPSLASLQPQVHGLKEKIGKFLISHLFRAVGEDFANGTFNGGMGGGSTLEYPRTVAQYYPETILRGTEYATKAVLEHGLGQSRDINDLEDALGEELRTMLDRINNKMRNVQQVIVHNVTAYYVSHIQVQWGPKLPYSKPRITRPDSMTRVYDLGNQYSKIRLANLSWIVPKTEIHRINDRSEFFSLIKNTSTLGAQITLDVECRADIEVRKTDGDVARKKDTVLVVSLQSDHFPSQTSQSPSQKALGISPKWKMVDLQYLVEEQNVYEELLQAQRNQQEEDERDPDD